MEPLFNAASSAAYLIYNVLSLPIRAVSYFIGKAVSIVSTVYNYMTNHSRQPDEEQPKLMSDRKVSLTTPEQPSTTPAAKVPASIPEASAAGSEAVIHQIIQPENSGFSPIYDRINQLNDIPIASVNAGDPRRYVGGGGINRAFGTLLDTTFNSMEYVRFHSESMQDLNSGQIKHETQSSKPDIFPTKIRAATVLYDCLLTHQDGRPNEQVCDGTVFIEEFNDADCPFNNQNNRAMVYIIPPNRRSYPDDDRFLKAVEKTAKNIIRAQEAHNQWRIRENTPPIPAVRLCAFSSDSFANRPDSSKIDKQKVLEATKKRNKLRVTRHHNNQSNSVQQVNGKHYSLSNSDSFTINF